MSTIRITRDVRLSVHTYDVANDRDCVVARQFRAGEVHRVRDIEDVGDQHVMEVVGLGSCLVASDAFEEFGDK